MFSRVLAGSVSVMTVGAAATALGLLGGITVGLIAGYYRGLVDDVLMRLVDALLSFPSVIVAVLVLTVLGSSELNLILIIGIVFTPIVARTVRSAVLVEREREYVAAARLLGASGPFIMVREVLPNITGPIVVEGTVRLGYAIFTAATISFLGFGLQQPSPDWGLTISLGRSLLNLAPWIVLFPAIALATLVIALNFVADGLKEALES
jgi:peptide/nickel transport system permease protein